MYTIDTVSSHINFTVVDRPCCVVGSSRCTVLYSILRNCVAQITVPSPLNARNGHLRICGGGNCVRFLLPQPSPFTVTGNSNRCRVPTVCWPIDRAP